ncbi:MAG: amino acid ABC transporter substrate-binding protein [Bacteroidetes bacterium]|nr:amino acid ABC transporter substrate-binding protein [Bacteroidota bacterium]
MRIQRTFVLFATFLLLLTRLNSFGQTDSLPYKHVIAVFAPLYLDSAFDAAYNYRYDKTFPKFINPGLEFYEGVQLALDSLSKENAPLEVYIYDTRSAAKPLSEQLKSPELEDAELILAYCSGQELAGFAYQAALKKIPFINVNLPVDGGVKNNPYYVMLNPTLKTHIENLYRYTQKNYALNNIVYFRKKGTMENTIKQYFDESGKTTMSVPLKIKYVELPDSFTINQLKASIDSTKQTLCIAGSLDENFGRKLATQLASITKSYKLTLMGMPTFDNISKDFSRPEYKGLEILYTTPFYNPRTDTVSKSIVNYFNTKLYARPSDMVMRGYEATWRFSKLLIKYKDAISSNLTKKEFNVFREFDIEPVINKQTNTTDYFENKKLFTVKWLDGLIKSAN